MSQERRINHRLISYWEALKGRRNFASESDIDIEELSDIWSSCFLIKVDHIDGKHALKFTYLGQDLIEAFSNDFTGLNFDSQVESSYGIMLNKTAMEVLSIKEPVVVEDEFTNDKNLLIKSRYCMLPLSDDDININYILGGMKWRDF